MATTKTDQSKRTLAMPEFVADALREHRARQAAERLRAGPRWKEHDLVFASTTGTPRSAGNVRRDFQAICEKAGLGKEWTPRELRHSFVSMLSGRRRGDRGNLASGRPFQHAHNRARLPAGAEARAQDRRRTHGPDLRPVIPVDSPDSPDTLPDGPGTLTADFYYLADLLADL